MQHPKITLNKIESLTSYCLLGIVDIFHQLSIRDAFSLSYSSQAKLITPLQFHLYQDSKNVISFSLAEFRFIFCPMELSEANFDPPVWLIPPVSGLDSQQGINPSKQCQEGQNSDSDATMHSQHSSFATLGSRVVLPKHIAANFTTLRLPTPQNHDLNSISCIFFSLHLIAQNVRSYCHLLDTLSNLWDNSCQSYHYYLLQHSKNDFDLHLSHNTDIPTLNVSSRSSDIHHTVKHHSNENNQYASIDAINISDIKNAWLPLRDVYYSKTMLFQSQISSDYTLRQIQRLLGVSRESLRLTTAQRGLCQGPCRIDFVVVRHFWHCSKAKRYLNTLGVTTPSNWDNAVTQYQQSLQQDSKLSSNKQDIHQNDEFERLMAYPNIFTFADDRLSSSSSSTTTTENKAAPAAQQRDGWRFALPKCDCDRIISRSISFYHQSGIVDLTKEVFQELTAACVEELTNRRRQRRETCETMKIDTVNGQDTIPNMLKNVIPTVHVVFRLQHEDTDELGKLSKDGKKSNNLNTAQQQEVEEFQTKLPSVTQSLSSFETKQQSPVLLIIEKETIFSRLVQLQNVSWQPPEKTSIDKTLPFVQTNNNNNNNRDNQNIFSFLKNAILITSKGYPNILTRQFIQQCIYSEYYNNHSTTAATATATTANTLPSVKNIVERIPSQLVLVDGDPYGIDIALKYMIGSSTQTFDCPFGLPTIQYIGIWPSILHSACQLFDYMLEIGYHCYTKMQYEPQTTIYQFKHDDDKNINENSHANENPHGKYDDKNTNENPLHGNGNPHGKYDNNNNNNNNNWYGLASTINIEQRLIIRMIEILEYTPIEQTITLQHNIQVMQCIQRWLKRSGCILQPKGWSNNRRYQFNPILSLQEEYIVLLLVHIFFQTPRFNTLAIAVKYKSFEMIQSVTDMLCQSLSLQDTMILRSLQVKNPILVEFGQRQQEQQQVKEDDTTDDKPKEEYVQNEESLQPADIVVPIANDSNNDQPITSNNSNDNITMMMVNKTAKMMMRELEYMASWNVKCEIEALLSISTQAFVLYLMHTMQDVACNHKSI